MNLGFPDGEFWKSMGTRTGQKQQAAFLRTPSICPFLEGNACTFAQVSPLHWLAPMKSKFDQSRGQIHSFQMVQSGITETSCISTFILIQLCTALAPLTFCSVFNEAR